MHGAGRPHRASGRWGVLGFGLGRGVSAQVVVVRSREATGGLGRCGGTCCLASDRGPRVLGPTPAVLPRRECSCAAAWDVLVGRRIEWLVGMLDLATGVPSARGRGFGREDALGKSGE